MIRNYIREIQITKDDILLFSSTNCQLCKKLIESKMVKDSKFDIILIKCEDYPDIANEYRIYSSPTLVKGDLKLIGYEDVFNYLKKVLHNKIFVLY